MTAAAEPGRATRAVTWDQVHRDARALAASLLGRHFTGIVAVTRGGLIPAAIVARELEIRLVESISVVSYAAGPGTAAAPRIVKHAPAAGDGAGFLVIDDLVDSGETARAIRAALPAAHFAVLYAKPAGLPLADSFVAEVAQDTWILFPWDTASVCPEGTTPACPEGTAPACPGGMTPAFVAPLGRTG